MRNIHIIPTKETGTFYISTDVTPNFYSNYRGEGHHIYITFDEPINREDWVYNVKYNNVRKFFLELNGVTSLQEDDKKIVLTTDPRLIKDGVQEIPNDFLMAFIMKANDSGKPIDIIEVEAITNTWEPHTVSVYKILTPKESKIKHVAETLKGKELFKESNDRARKTLSEIKSLPIVESLEDKLKKIDILYNEVSLGLQDLLNEDSIISHRPTARLLESFKHEFDTKSKNFNSRNNDRMTYIIDSINYAIKLKNETRNT